MYAPYAGDDGRLLHINGKFTMEKFRGVGQGVKQSCGILYFKLNRIDAINIFSETASYI